ncbi:PRD domain-containing protein, partial [Neobacillus niacini]|uniref:PRD domain-containing protein n=1 Tax=Neobacillus niacini TaxID=86668 RepID=UPI0030021164
RAAARRLTDRPRKAKCLERKSTVLFNTAKLKGGEKGMQVIKKLNNNAALALVNEKECIAIGKGIGFPKIPYTLNDTGKVDKIYYDIDNYLLTILTEIPENIIEVTTTIFNKAEEELKLELNKNLIITLADHISFAIQRLKKGVKLSVLFSHDIKYLYPKEYSFASQALNFINDKLNCDFPSEEIVSITIHIVNSSIDNSKMNEAVKLTKTLNDIVSIIEKSLHITIDNSSYSFNRFITHLRMLFMRKDEYPETNSTNAELFSVLKDRYPDSIKVIERIENYFNEKLNWSLQEEELLYLMIHVNKLKESI